MNATNELRALNAKGKLTQAETLRYNQLVMSYQDAAIDRLDDPNRDTSLIGRDRGSMNREPSHPLFGAGANDRTNASGLDAALNSWAKNAMGCGATPQDQEACERYGMALNSSTFHASLGVCGPTPGLRLMKNALSISQGSSGGFLVPEGFVASLERALLDYSGVMQTASIMKTESGNPLIWPTSDDTMNTGELIGEGVPTDLTSTVSFGRVTFQAFVFSSKLVRVSNSLLQDSGIDLASALGTMLGERIARSLNPYLTTGLGSNQPLGLLTSATLGKTAASATLISLDDVLDLMESLDPSYRQNASFMCHSSIVTQLRKLKTGTGEYLWENSTQAGEPSTLWGHKVFLNQSMDSSIASGKKTLLFGDLSKYKIRIAAGTTLQRLTERFAEFYESGFLSFMRADGALLDAGTHPVKYLQH